MLSALLSAQLSARRLDRFLQADELAPPPGDAWWPEAPAVVLGRTGFEWTPGTPVLRDLTLQLPRGKLSLIVGAVGAGKTSVLAACLGEMVRTDTHGRPAAPHLCPPTSAPHLCPPPLPLTSAPHLVEAAAPTPCTRGCNPVHSRLQPRALEAATPCTRGCNPVHSRLQPRARVQAASAYASQVHICCMHTPGAHRRRPRAAAAHRLRPTAGVAVEAWRSGWGLRLELHRREMSPRGLRTAHSALLATHHATGMGPQ
jgi:energy-coupling factor transporter ATP-binding protein EcfA2